MTHSLVFAAVFGFAAVAFASIAKQQLQDGARHAGTLLGLFRSRPSEYTRRGWMAAVAARVCLAISLVALIFNVWRP